MALRQSPAVQGASQSAAAHLNGHQVEEDATSLEALVSRLAEMEEQVRQLNEANRTLGKRNEDLECEVRIRFAVKGCLGCVISQNNLLKAKIPWTTSLALRLTGCVQSFIVFFPGTEQACGAGGEAHAVTGRRRERGQRVARRRDVRYSGM